MVGRKVTPYAFMQRFVNGLLALLLVIAATGCVSHEELINFKPLDPVSLSPQQITNNTSLTVQPEDLLRITISSLNPEAAEPFNQSQEDSQQRNQSGSGGVGSLQLELTTGYFVDDAGYIDFPVLGSLDVGGLTLSEIKELIAGRLADGYLKDPVVNVRFLNFKVTILGEVMAPGLLRLSNKRVTLLEALGMAGDLTNYANRTNVLIMREDNGERTFARLNLQNEDIFSSPYFYLEQNDVIYVEPIEARVATVADPLQRIVGYASAALSLVSIVIALALR
ncbi:polysaccharide export outer membrane protein [Neolewinella xylanilytica]|uniref:Polysaccharide export outer membrane protein n=2 Tax=Neolewinella xylanilytica TaxID=1514080 RepID=A0A2S6I911_9BACT|nr:polysaccharide export outer membrane protein [Neolewinella xylanilytica]